MWPEPNSGCWLWTGTVSSDGYARIFIAHGRGVETRAARFAYKEFVGPIPEGFVLDHLCRNRLCVNPTHLEPVTNNENIRRGNVGSNFRDRTHCVNGHEFTEENTKYQVVRVCRSCHRGRVAKYRRSVA